MGRGSRKVVEGGSGVRPKTDRDLCGLRILCFGKEGGVRGDGRVGRTQEGRRPVGLRVNGCAVDGPLRRQKEDRTRVVSPTACGPGLRHD